MNAGIIVKGYGGFYFVQSENKIWRCRGRGRLRYEKQRLLPGDHVQFEPLGTEEGIIEMVLPRKNVLHRPLIASVDQAVLVISLAQPEPDLKLLDRLLVLCGVKDIDVVICFNKLDLVPVLSATDLATLYQGIGYSIVLTCAIQGTGLKDLQELLKNKVSVLAGPSGVGKSTLLNALEPSLSLKTGEVSKKLKRGHHTTKYVELLPIAGGLVADTPGFSNLDLPRIKRRELEFYFLEFSKFAEKCQFPDCLHLHEPGCAVRDALTQGNISSSRYQNYLELLSDVTFKEWIYE